MSEVIVMVHFLDFFDAPVCKCGHRPTGTRFVGSSTKPEHFCEECYSEPPQKATT